MKTKKTIKTFAAVLTFALIFSLFQLATFAGEYYDEKTGQIIVDGGYIIDDLGYVLSLGQPKMTSEYEPDSVEYIESLSMDYSTSTVFPTQGLPETADNSTSEYFPEIAEQVGNSSTAFATAYYQYTYSVNKLTKTAYSHDNAFCPQYVYKTAGKSEGVGTSFKESFDVIGGAGCLRYSDYDESLIATPADFASYVPTAEPVKGANLTPGFLPIGCSEWKDGEIIPGNKMVTVGTGLPSDMPFFTVRTLLALGEVVTVAANQLTYSEETEDGELVDIFSYGTFAPHAVAIVGYDDNFWYDVNKNGEKDAGETGAFKVAGTHGKDFGKDGFYWILYDAFNKVSNVENVPYSQSGRGLMTVLYRGQNGEYFTPFFFLKAEKNDPSHVHDLASDYVFTIQPTKNVPGLRFRNCKICGEMIAEEVIYFPGDVNGDGKLNLSDLPAMKRALTSDDNVALVNIDVNDDGKYTLTDLAALKKLLA